MSIAVSVMEPTVCNEKFGSYISYKVSSESSKSGFRPGLVVVDRRYSDFAWLHAELQRELPGSILAPLPEKQTVGRFSQEFIEARRRSLERYLTRIASHPELSFSPILVTFLQGDDSMLTRAREEAKASKPKLSTTAVNWFEEKVSTIANGKVEIEKSAADIKIEEMSTYIAKLEKHLQNVVKHSEIMVKKLRETSSAMLEFGQQLHFLGQSEGDAVGASVVQVGEVLCNAANANTAKAEEELAKFVEPVEDYARMIGSVKAAINQRQSKKSAYIFSLSDVEGKSAACKKLVGVPGKETQLSAKEQALRVAEDQRDQAKIEYERVTERLMVEFELFKSRKVLDFKEIALNFVSIQVDFSRRTEEIWRNVLPILQATPVDGFTSYEESARPISAYTDGVRPETANYGNSYNGPQSNFYEEDDEEYAGV